MLEASLIMIKAARSLSALDMHMALPEPQLYSLCNSANEELVIEDGSHL